MASRFVSYTHFLVQQPHPRLISRLKSLTFLSNSAIPPLVPRSGLIRVASSLLFIYRTTTGLSAVSAPPLSYTDNLISCGASSHVPWTFLHLLPLYSLSIFVCLARFVSLARAFSFVSDFTFVKMFYTHASLESILIPPNMPEYCLGECFISMFSWRACVSSDPPASYLILRMVFDLCAPCPAFTCCAQP